MAYILRERKEANESSVCDKVVFMDENVKWI